MTRTINVAWGVLLVGFVWATASCDKGLTSVNKNPNAPTAVPVEFLLPQAIRDAVENVYGSWQLLSHTGIWPQHFVEIQYPDEERGIVRPGNMDAFWGNFYAGPLKDAQTIIDLSEEYDLPNAKAVGLIWRTWIFHIVTDYWGDVPYSAALKGEEEGGATPVYDAQKDIYTGMLADLTTAVSLLSPSEQTFGQGDILYDNDMLAWGRFANSLRMRLAMRLSEVDPSTGKTEFAAAYHAGGFTSNGDNAFLDFPGPPYENPLYENWQGRDDHAVSATMVDTLISLNDPRLHLYAEPAASDGQYRGHQNGRISLPAGQSLSDISRIGDFWRADGAATPATLMSYGEVLFLEAEAAARGWISGSADALYTQAIEASMKTWREYGVGPTDAQITAYLAQPSVAFGGINSIHLQKWIALWMHGPEAWAHIRRVDVPHLAMGPDLQVSRIPVRLPYPDTEQSLNKTNLDAAIARQSGGLDLITPVWWDKN